MMRWTMAERRVLAPGVAARYGRSSKKEKGRILDELMEMTEYQRGYAAWLLNRPGRAGRRDPTASRTDGGRGRRRRRYGADVQRELARLWKLLDYLCGKRLVAALPALPAVIEALERHGEGQWTAEPRRIGFMRQQAGWAGSLCQTSCILSGAIMRLI